MADKQKRITDYKVAFDPSSPEHGNLCISSMSESKVENQDGKKKINIPVLDKSVGKRTLIAFWILGLCNNYGYVVMLSAAHDILSHKIHDGDSEMHINSTGRDCNEQSTGAILLADIIPSLVIKVSAPFFPLWIHVRMILTITLSCAGYILVGVGSGLPAWVAITGVVVTALSSGLGEASLLPYMSYYKSKNVISTWSSGTGGAGFFGAFTYAGLISLGLSSSTTMYLLLVIPGLMGVSFWILLEHPSITSDDSSIENGEVNNSAGTSGNGMGNTNVDGEALPLTSGTFTFTEKLKLVPSLLKYMVPLGLVYLFEYFINQGLFELVNFNNIWLDKSSQYRWYQVDYQIGVFVSRSSINLFTIRKTWILAVLQGINVIIFTTEAVMTYLPTIFIVLAFVLWEGLLGGASYVNTYYCISTEVAPEKREFSMAITSLSDALGISIAGFVAMPVHNYICQLPRYK